MLNMMYPIAGVCFVAPSYFCDTNTHGPPYLAQHYHSQKVIRGKKGKKHYAFNIPMKNCCNFQGPASVRRTCNEVLRRREVSYFQRALKEPLVRYYHWWALAPAQKVLY